MHIDLVRRLKSDVKTGIYVSVTIFLASTAAAEDVHIKSHDGAIDLVGPLISYNNDYYEIETNFGAVRVSRTNARCDGAACPADLQVADTTWTVALWGEPRPATSHVERLAELVAERTDGAFVINLDYAAHNTSEANLEAIATADHQMAQICAGDHPHKTRALTILELPFLGISTLDQDIAVSRLVYDHPAVQQEMAEWNAEILMPSPQLQKNIIGRGYPPSTLDEFSALKIGTTGAGIAAVKALGARHVDVDVDEVETALADRKIGAAAFAPDAYDDENAVANAEWWTTNLNAGTRNCPVIINADAMAALSDEHRAILLDSTDEALAHYVDAYQRETLENWDNALRAYDVAELTISEAVLADVHFNAGTPVAVKWITTNSSQSFPARDLYSLVKSAVN